MAAALRPSSAKLTTGLVVLDVRADESADELTNRFYPYNLGKEVGYLGWLGNRKLGV